jgi:glycosyltransferase involved in cell wall biosynthesis
VPPTSLRKRVLLLAYACSPYRGSEAGVGWNRVIESGKYFDTWVICGKREFEDDITGYLEKYGEPPGVHFYIIPRTRMEKWLWKMPMGFYVGYNRWQKRAYRIAVSLHKKYHFDLAHQVNWTGFREPGYLWNLDIPFVWGPVGGTQNFPWRCLVHSGVAGAIKEGCRSVLNWIQFRFSWRVRRAAKRAAILLTCNSTGLQDFQTVHKVKPQLLLETGVTTTRHKQSINRNPGDPLKILWSGEFKHHKALPFLLCALSGLPDRNAYVLKILGHGPLEQKWRRLSRHLGVETHCDWVGWLPFADAMKLYEWADVLVFTSLRDSSGNVMLEALSNGVPVICYNHQGAGDIVTDGCGIRIPVTNRNKMVQDLTHAIEILLLDRAKLGTLSRGATERARGYLWSQNGAHLAQLCQQILSADSRGT